MSTPFPTVKLGHQDVASVILGQSPPSSVYNEVGDGLPFFQGKADFGLLYPMPRVWCRTGQKFASAGDVLISVRAPVGDVNVATDECAIGRGISAIRAGSKMDPWFLYFALLYAKPILESRATGSTFASVNKATLLNLDIPFPDKSQQSKIGVFLHNLVKQIEQETLIIAVAQDLKKAVMQILFTHGLRGEAQKKTEIGPVPESWELTSFGVLFNIVQGFSLKKNLSEDGKGVPFLRTSNIYWGRTELNSVSRMRIDPASLGDRVLEAGDLLVCEGGEIGRAAVWDGEIANCTFQNHIHRLRPQDDGRVAPRFTMSWLEEGFCHRRIYEGAGNRTTIPNLSQARLGKLSMPLPSLDEQCEIVTILDAIDRKIDLHRKKRAMLDDLFKVLLHKLMTGDIRVGALNLWALQSNHNSLLKPRETNGR